MKCCICNTNWYWQTHMEPAEPCDCGAQLGRPYHVSSERYKELCDAWKQLQEEENGSGHSVEFAPYLEHDTKFDSDEEC